MRPSELALLRRENLFRADRSGKRLDRAKDVHSAQGFTLPCFRWTWIIKIYPHKFSSQIAVCNLFVRLRQDLAEVSEHPDS